MEQATIVKTSLIIALQTTNIHAFTDQIKSTVIPLYNIKDSQNANIFHEIASSVIKEDFLIEALQVLIVEFNDRYFEEAATIVKSLLDSKRVCDGNSPFLDSVIYNRIKVMRRFIELGADAEIMNAKGQNAVHLAAESGFDRALVYLYKGIGLPSMIGDANLRRPLHLAAAHGHLTTCSFLIAWGADVKSRDELGNTPLHIASASHGYKLVKLLIIKGSNMFALNNQGQSAKDIAIINQNSDAIALMSSLKCSQKINPVFLEKTNHSKSCGKFVVFCVGLALRFLSVLLCFYDSSFDWKLILSLILIFLSFGSFVLVSLKNPGYIEKGQTSILELIEVYRSEFICGFCEVRKHYLTRHCFTCDKCVDKMDHHCPWIYNCVGKKNYKHFIIFLFINSLDCFLSFLITLLTGLTVFSKRKPYERTFHDNIGVLYFTFSALNILIFSLVFTIFLQHVITWVKRKREFSKILPNSIETTDTSSMLLTPSISSSYNTQSIFLAKPKTPIKKCCFNPQRTTQGISLRQSR